MPPLPALNSDVDHFPEVDKAFKIWSEKMDILITAQGECLNTMFSPESVLVEEAACKEVVKAQTALEKARVTATKSKKK